MSITQAKKHLAKFGRQDDVLEMPTSTATVQLAAESLGTIPAKIAKTIALKGNSPEEFIVIVTAGDARLDNKKFKEARGSKPKMLSPEETLEVTGYAIGGVCPFGLEEKGNIKILLDESLKRFTTVFPACGSSNSAINVTLEQLEEYTGNPDWVNGCKDWDESLKDS